MADPRDFRRGGASGDSYNPEGGNGGGLKPAPMASPMTFIPPSRTTATQDGLNALATIEPEIKGFFDRRAQQQAQEDDTAGRQAALQHAMEAGEAVKQGKIAPNESKWFMKGYKAQYGENLGQQWGAEAKVLWEQSPEKNSDKPEAFQQFYTNFMDGKMKEQAALDPDVRAGMLPQLQRARAVLGAAQAEYSAKKVVEAHVENVGTAISGDIDLYLAGKLPKDQLFANIKQRDSAGRLMGISNEDMNKTVVQAITNKAMEKGDLALLGLLKEYPHVGNNPKYATATRSAEMFILNKAQTQENRALIAMQRQRMENERVGTLIAYDTFDKQKAAGQPYEVTPELKKTLMATGMPGAVDAAYKHLKVLQSHDEHMTVQEIGDVNRQIIEGGDQALSKWDYLVQTGRIKNPAVLNATKQLAIMATHINNDPAFTHYTGRILDFAKQGPLGQVMIEPIVAQDAASRFRSEYIDFVHRNPQASQVEREKFAQDLASGLFREMDKYKIGQGGGNLGGGGNNTLKTIPTDQLLQKLQQSK